MTSAGVRDPGLDDGEFVTAQPRDEIVPVDAATQGHGDGFQQFIADQMSKRIVDALEFIDVDIDHREPLAFRNPRELPFQSLVEQRPVRQIGQRVVMRKMRDPLFDAPALGDVLQCRHPPTVGKRTIQHLDRASVGRVQDRLKYPSFRQFLEQRRAILIDVAGERPGFPAVFQQFANGAAGLHDIG